MVYVIPPTRAKSASDEDFLGRIQDLGSNILAACSSYNQLGHGLRHSAYARKKCI